MAKIVRTPLGVTNRRNGQEAWLDAPAAASLRRAFELGAPRVDLSDAGRTYAEQKQLYEAYLRGELPATAARPGTSLHETGLAVDAREPLRAWLHEHGAAFGWIGWTVAREPWHFVYVADRDTYRPSEEDPMERKTLTRSKNTPLAAGKWKTIPLDDAGNTSALIRAGRFDTQVALSLTGLPAGREAQVRLVRVKTDAKGKNPKVVGRYPITELIGTGGSTFGLHAMKGTLPVGERLRVQVAVWDPGVTVTFARTVTDRY